MILKKGSYSEISLLSGIAIVMSIVTGIFGTPFLRVIRNTYGSLAFWGLVLLFLGGSVALKASWLSVVVGSVWLTTGISLELEKRKVSFLTNSVLSLTVGFLICALGMYGALQELGILSLDRATEYFKEVVKPMMAQSSKGQMNNEMDYQAIVLQVPSMVFVFLLVSLAFGYLMERRVRHWLRLRKHGHVYKFNFLKFRAKDGVIWVALFSLLFSTLGTMGKDFYWLGIIGSNLVNVFFIVFLFQGIAILENILMRMKAGVFFRSLSYFIFIGQLFLVLSIVGFLDYWFDIRQRIKIMNRQAT